MLSIDWESSIDGESPGLLFLNSNRLIQLWGSVKPTLLSDAQRLAYYKEVGAEV